MSTVKFNAKIRENSVNCSFGILFGNNLCFLTSSYLRHFERNYNYFVVQLCTTLYVQG